MSLAQDYRNAVIDSVEFSRALEEHDIPEIENTDLKPINSLSSAHLQPTSERGHLPDTRHTRKAASFRPQLSEKEKATELAAKNKEIEILQTCYDERNSEITRLKVKHDQDRLANREAARKCLDRAKIAADREAKALKEENQDLKSRREKAESRASDAEGRAQGLQDQLRATQRQADNWEALYLKAQEDARNQILSAYEVTPVQVPEEDQQTTTKPSQEKELYILVEELRKENGELKEKTGLLTAEVLGWKRAWDEAVKTHQSWEEEIHRWQEVTRRLYNQEKQEALAAERTKSQVVNGRDTTEHDICRRWEKEKQRALAVERENCRLQWESEKCSLRGERGLKKLRRRIGCERKVQKKAKKFQLKWEFNRAVSHAVNVERSLLQTQFQMQFQTELSKYKTQVESEHAKSRSQSKTQNNTAPADKVLLDEEIKKRNDFIETQKDHLRKAFEAKREAESAKKELEKELKTVREENERLSRDVIDYKSQKVMASQTKNEAQITLMTQELVRALKLFTEIALLGLDEKHRNLLNELVVANKVVRDIRVTIEEGSLVDYEEFQDRVDRVFATSDGFDILHPQERPALRAQLLETYSILGGLNNILAGKREDTANQEILERIYRDIVKGKEKQGAIIGSGAAVGPSYGASGEMDGAPLPQPRGSKLFTSDANHTPQTGFSNTYPVAATTKPNAAGSQGEPEYVDSATAHPFEANNEWNQEKAPAMQAVYANEPSKGSKELEVILTKLRNSAATSSSQAVPQDQSYRQVVQQPSQAHQSPLPGLSSQRYRYVQNAGQPAGWTDIMTGWVRYLLQQGTDMNGIEAGMRSFFPAINNMVGVRQHLGNIKMEWEGQQVQMLQN